MAPYITPAEVRDQTSLAEKFDDTWVEKSIKVWSDWVERWTGRFFEVRARTLREMGNGSILWLLEHPPADANIKVYLNEETKELQAADFYLFGTPDQPEDQSNPRIRLRNGMYFSGDRLQVITGNFGMIEMVDSQARCPQLVKRALALLVERHARFLSYGNPNLDRIISETTDRHSYTLGDLPDTAYWFPTRNTEIDQIVRSFRKPSGMGFSCVRG